MSRLFLTVSAAVLVATFALAASAQTPPAAATPPAEATPQATPPVATPPATTPPAPAQPGPVTAADPFGVEVALEPKTFIYMKGTADAARVRELVLERAQG